MLHRYRCLHCRLAMSSCLLLPGLGPILLPAQAQAQANHKPVRSSSGKSSPVVSKRDKALVKAVQKRDINAVQNLVLAGANANVKDASGTPVLILILRHALEDADANKGADYADLFIHLMLLQHKADPNARGAAGAPALFMAASTGCAEFTKVLLKFGAKADLASPEGFTPLMGAALVRDDAAARMLIQRGANVNAKTKDGMTPLLSSAIPNTDAKVLHRDPLKVFRLLLEHGADIHYRGPGGSNALMGATLAGEPEMARILLMKGAKMEAQDDDGGTALFYAVQYSRQPLVALLLEQGANVNATTKKGKTPLMVAVEEDAEEIAEMLIQKGADLNVRNKAGLTALGIARKGAYQGMINLLTKAGAKD